MKRLFLTLLCCLIFCGTADARMLQGIAGGSLVGATGTWYIAPTTHSEIESSSTASYALGTLVTIPAGTVTKIAYKVASAGNATVGRVALYDGPTTDSTRLVTGTCTPTDSSWCIVTVAYAASAGNYRVLFMSDGSTLTSYNDSDGGAGTYVGSSYVLFADNTGYPIYDSTTAGATWAIAICVGTCVGEPD